MLLGAGRPVVLAAIDWCEIRNDAYDRWREVLAEAAGTEPRRVMVTSLHQHDTPIADLTAQRLLDQRQAAGSICDLDFHERAVQGVARALRGGLETARPVTHVGTGQAKVEKVASNRRYVGADGRPRFDRMSATRDPLIRDQPEGPDRPLAQDAELLGRRPPGAGSELLRDPPDELLRQGRAFRPTSSASPASDGRKTNPASSRSTSRDAAATSPPGSTTTALPRIAPCWPGGSIGPWWPPGRRPSGSRSSGVGSAQSPLRLEPRSSPGFTMDDLGETAGDRSRGRSASASPRWA